MGTLWENKSAVITGAANGLGNALAQRLLSLGAKVALLDQDAEQFKSIAEHYPGLAYPYGVDVVNFENVKKVVDTYHRQAGKIDILVNCAGIVGRTGIKSHEVDGADFEKVLAVNVLGSFNMFKAVVPYMLENKYGRVLHIASISGKDGNAGMVAYSASKAAVIGMTKVQGKEYAETGVLVNAIAPAVIRTAILDGQPPEQVKYMTDKIPMKRCGTLDEFVEMASFIISDQNTFTTGFTYDLSGGRALY